MDIELRQRIRDGGTKTTAPASDSSWIVPAPVDAASLSELTNAASLRGSSETMPLVPVMR